MYVGDILMHFKLSTVLLHDRTFLLRVRLPSWYSNNNVTNRTSGEIKFKFMKIMFGRQQVITHNPYCCFYNDFKITAQRWSKTCNYNTKNQEHFRRHFQRNCIMGPPYTSYHKRRIFISSKIANRCNST